jgi:hypothetical protein
LGEQSEAIIIAKLLEIGYGVLTPFGENKRYDLVIEDAEGNFYRIQCKTGWLHNDGAGIKFATSSMYYRVKDGKAGHGRKNYQGQIDYFAVYSPDIKKTYLVPVDHVGVTDANLRLIPPVNNQEKYIRWAKDYEI